MLRFGVLLLALFPACSAIVTPDPNRLGGGLDAGTDEVDAPIGDDDAPSEPSVALSSNGKNQRATLREHREATERSYIIDTLKELDWNISKASVVLGVERTNLHKKIRAYGIKRGDG